MPITQNECSRRRSTNNDTNDEDMQASSTINRLSDDRTFSGRLFHVKVWQRQKLMLLALYISRNKTWLKVKLGLHGSQHRKRKTIGEAPLGCSVFDYIEPVRLATICKERYRIII